MPSIEAMRRGTEVLDKTRQMSKDGNNDVCTLLYQLATLVKQLQMEVANLGQQLSDLRNGTRP